MLHTCGSGDSENPETVGEHDLRGTGEHESRGADRIRLAEHVMLVVPRVYLPSRLKEIARYEVRLQGSRGERD